MRKPVVNRHLRAIFVSLTVLMLLAPTVLSPLIVNAASPYTVTAITTATTDYADTNRNVTLASDSSSWNITYDGIEAAITDFTANAVLYLPLDESFGSAFARRNTANPGDDQVAVWHRVVVHAPGPPNEQTVSGRYNNDLDSVFSSRNIYMGAENLFVNDTAATNVETNVERMDYIFAAPMSARDELGFAVFERGRNTGGANGTFKIAAITGIDGGGLPTFTGSSIITVAQNSYGSGTLDGSFRYDVFRKTNFADTDLNTIHANNINIGPQGISGVLITSTDLVSAGTFVYGYAVFGADVTAATAAEIYDWDDDTYYPQDSDFDNDMDLVSTGALAYASSLIITGNVFDDANGLTDSTVNGTGTDAGGPLFAILVDGRNDVVDCVPVSPSGVFILGGAAASTTYTVLLSTTSETAGNPAPTPSLPVGWTSTGEHLGAGAGNDGTINGILDPVDVVTTNVTDANFGIQEASITVAKSVNPTSVSSTGDVTYTVVLTNTCDGPLTGVTINDSLEPDVTPGTAVESITDDDILEVGETWTWTYTFTIAQDMLDAGDPIENTASVDTDQTDPAEEDDAEVTIVQDPSLTVDKVGTVDMAVVPQNGQVNPGDEIHYVFTVTNTGNVTLTNIVLTDPKVTVVGGPIASLAPGASDSSLTATYVLTPADIGAGQVLNTVTATGVPPAGAQPAEVTANGEALNHLLPHAVGGEAFSIDKVHLIVGWMVENLKWLFPA